MFLLTIFHHVFDIYERVLSSGLWLYVLERWVIWLFVVFTVYLSTVLFYALFIFTYQFIFLVDSIDKLTSFHRIFFRFKLLSCHVVVLLLLFQASAKILKDNAYLFVSSSVLDLFDLTADFINQRRKYWCNDWYDIPTSDDDDKAHHRVSRFLFGICLIYGYEISKHNQMIADQDDENLIDAFSIVSSTCPKWQRVHDSYHHDGWDEHDKLYLYGWVVLNIDNDRWVYDFPIVNEENKS